MAVYKTLQEIVDTWSGCLFGILPISEKTKILYDDDSCIHTQSFLGRFWIFWNFWEILYALYTK